jgi:hypothetical protein
MKRLSMKFWGIVFTLAVASVVWGAAQVGFDKYGGQFPVWFNKGLYVGPDNPNPTSSTTNKITRSLGNSATINFSSSYLTPADSSAITVTGAQAGDPCQVGVPTAAGALKANYACYVSAADAVKVKFTPEDKLFGQQYMDGGAQTVTVSASSICMCNDITDATKGCRMNVSSTTATITGTTDSFINYVCAAPVDPASGTFYVRLTSGQ